MSAGDVYRSLWRHKLFVVVLTAVFVGAAWYLTSREADSYEASTLVRAQQGGRSAGSAEALQASQTLAQTYARIVEEGALRDEIAMLVRQCSRRTPAPDAGPRRRGGATATRPTLANPPRGSCESLGGIRGIAPRRVSAVGLSASPVQDLDLLSITARSDNPRNAVVAANAAPWGLRAFIRRSGSRTERIITVKPASIPTSPASRQLPLKIVIATMLGLIFNGALALILELFRDRLPEPDEFSRALGHPVLATIPSLRLHPLPVDAATREEPSLASGLQQPAEGELGSGAPDPQVSRER
jgi:capsular polysaccharide biosynthesis protein